MSSQLFSSDALMQSAQKAAGYSDFGCTTFLEPLQKFLEALEETGDLHPFGRFYVKKVITGLLVHRLRLTALWQGHPQIFDETIRKPIIILGLPRTGTSFLFNLLAQDPDHRFLSNWEATISQVPPEGSYVFQSDPRRKQAMTLMKLQDRLAPNLKHIHTFYLDGPEECTPLLLQGFTTLALVGMFNVPRYSLWLDTASHLSTYHHYKRILQTLQWKYPGERWLVKSPAHIEAITAILDVLPDACIVQMHRDPVKSIPSYASLCATFRGIYMQHIDVEALGSQVLTRLAADYDNYLIQRQQCDSSRFMDVQYHELIDDPFGTACRIYERFDLQLSAEAEKNMGAFLAKQPKEGSAHRYRPEDFGLSHQQIRDHLRDYILAFNVPDEI